jgi:Ca2+-binding EF-hand superfamily protein
MQTRNKILIASIGGALALGLTSAAVAGKSHHDRGGHKQAIFGMMDADGDGKITRAEADAYRDDRMAKFDTDGNGSLNPDEYIAMMEDFRRQMMLVKFNRSDADGDGVLSKDEVGSRADRMFQHMDRNDDGVIEQDEMKRRGKHRDGDGKGGRYGKDRD